MLDPGTGVSSSHARDDNVRQNRVKPFYNSWVTLADAVMSDVRPSCKGYLEVSG